MPASQGVHGTRIIFDITEEVITAGMQRNSIYCPIAETVRRTIPVATAIRVDLATVRWTDPVKRLRYIYLTPIAAQQFIVDYDRGYGKDRVKPFKMRLRDGHIIETRPEAERRKRRESGTPRAKPVPRTIKLKDKGSVVEVTGGHPLPVGNPASPANHRKYGARQLRP